MFQNPKEEYASSRRIMKFHRGLKLAENNKEKKKKKRWCHVKEIIAKNKVMKFSPTFSFRTFIFSGVMFNLYSVYFVYRVR